VLGTAPGDFKAFAEKLRNIQKHGSVVVFGNQAALDAANAELGDKKLTVESAFGTKTA
jgi:hypothetical protein